MIIDVMTAASEDYLNDIEYYDDDDVNGDERFILLGSF